MSDDPTISVGRSFHVMAKPIGPTCNLNCTYCYYLSKENLPDGPERGRMADEMLEKYIKLYIEGAEQSEIVFSWQGGEPTLLGLDFYKKVVSLQKKYAFLGKQIENDLQTNGTLLNEEWCSFLKENNFLIGLSIDGPRELHDHYRPAKNGQPSFDQVYESVKMLKKHRIPFNTLTVVNRKNSQYPLEVYRFLTRDLGSRRIQFIPCVEPEGFETMAPGYWDIDSMPTIGTPASRPGAPDSVVTEWSVDPETYGEFLCKVFDEWYKKDIGRVFVNLFETLVAQRLGMPPQICVFSKTCGKSVVLERDGGVYSCDHYVYPQYLLGNIKGAGLQEMVYSDKQEKFGNDKENTLPAYCRKCWHLSDCWGECPKNRFIRTPDGEPGLNYLCRGLKRFFTHVRPHINDIASAIRKDGLVNC